VGDGEIDPLQDLGAVEAFANLAEIDLGQAVPQLLDAVASWRPT